MYGIMPTCRAQVILASMQSYEMTSRVINHPGHGERKNNVPAHPDVGIGRKLPFQSPRQLPPQQRSNVNPLYRIADSSSDEQDPIIRTATRHISVNTLDLKSTPPPQAIIGEVDPPSYVGQHQQRSSRDIQDHDAGHGDRPNGHRSGVE